VAPSSSG